MKLQDLLIKRSGHKCELCSSTEPLKLYEVQPQQNNNEDDCIMICNKCIAQIEKKEELNTKHWSCLTESMWSEIFGIQVISWRMLNRFRHESWAADNLDVMYLAAENLFGLKLRVSMIVILPLIYIKIATVQYCTQAILLHLQNL